MSARVECKRCAGCNLIYPVYWHVEHRFPVSRGGEHTEENIVIACPSCNLSKHVKTEEEFYECSGGA